MIYLEDVFSQRQEFNVQFSFFFLNSLGASAVLKLKTSSNQGFVFCFFHFDDTMTNMLMAFTTLCYKIEI